MKGLTLNEKELARLQLLNNVIEHNVPMVQAAEVLGVTERHAWRILAAYRREGAAALAHGNRGRQPPNAVSDDLAVAVVTLAATRYSGANHTHFTDLLREREGIDLGRQTVRRILTKAGMPSPKKRRPPKHRVRRERMPQAWMSVQVDGSHHPWLEERGPRFVLLLAVDDATGKVANAVFRQAEDARGYFILMDGLIQRWGIPLALYTDRHGVFKFSGRPRQVPRPVESTHFSRSLRELGVQQIFARSPQAKGRVERAAGTFQDRLVTELRLAGASTIAQASEVLEQFIPRFNAKFGVPADQPDAAYRPMGPCVNLTEILCFKHPRKVARDNTVKYQWRTMQLLPGEDRPSYAGARVEVLELPDGSLRIQHQGKTIPAREAARRSAGAMRGASGALASTPDLGRIVNRLVKHRLTQPQLQNLANLQASSDDEDDGDTRLEETEMPATRKLEPTPRQLALWKAVQHAKLQGVSLRGIARELGIARNTVRRYADATSPPANRPRTLPAESATESITEYAD